MLRPSCIVGLICLCSPGCWERQYYLPETQQIGAVPVKESDVHVFRVDVTEHQTPHGNSNIVSWHVEHELARLANTELGMTPPQSKRDVEYGSTRISLTNTATETTRHRLALRFYRPGYRPIHVKPGAEPKSLDWVAVADLDGQEKAVDDLMGFRFGSGVYQDMDWISTSAPGTRGPAHREALLFGAAEYDRIAALVKPQEPDAEMSRKRLASKAQRLRALADGKSA